MIRKVKFSKLKEQDRFTYNNVGMVKSSESSAIFPNIDPDTTVTVDEPLRFKDLKVGEKFLLLDDNDTYMKVHDSFISGMKKPLRAVIVDPPYHRGLYNSTLKDDTIVQRIQDESNSD